MTFDTFFVFFYLAIIMMIGLWSGRNIRNLTEYSVAQRSYPAVIIFATLTASFIGGGFTLGNAEKVFLLGIGSSLAIWGFSLKEILVARYIAPKMDQFRDAISVGDILQKSYGKVGKVCGGIASVMLCAGIVGAQVSAIGYVFSVFLGMSHFWGIMLGCGMVTIYVAVGGIKAVVLTDVVQFAILAIGFPLTLIFGVIHVGGVSEVIAQIPDTHRAIFAQISLLGLISLFLTFVVGEALVPPYMQRLLIAKDAKNAARGTLWSGLFSIPFVLIVGLIGLIALAMDPALNPNMAIPYTVQAVLPIGVKGLVIAGIISVVMSSADSFLNSASIAFTHDVLTPLSRKKYSEKQTLLIAKTVALLIGVLAVIFALSVESILSLLILAYDFWAPTILPPLIAAIFGFRASSRVFLLCVASGIIVDIVWQHLLGAPWGITGLVVGTISNACVLALSLSLTSGNCSLRGKAERSPRFGLRGE